MTHRFNIILFATLFSMTIIPASLAAQGRGARHGGAVGAVRAPVSSPRSTSVFRTPPVVTPGLGTPRVAPVAPIARSPRVFVHPERRVFGSQPFFGGFYSPFYSPYYSPYLFETPYYTSPDYLAQTYDPGQVTQNDEADLSYQVQQLSLQIEQLREQQALAASQPAPPPAPAAPEAPPTPTTLVFRDGHRMSILNYAIVGETLWVLDENRSDRIPLSDLNLDATQRENRSHGVRFLIP